MTTQWRAAWVAGLVVAAAGVASAQQPGAKESKKVEELSIRTKDGWTLPISYYHSDGENTPVVILLHGKGGNQQVWKGLADRLHKSSYAVVTVDLRKHGESQAPPNAGPRAERLMPVDFEAMMAFDLEAVKDFLLERHAKKELNIRKTAIVAADDMAPVAVNFALRDWLKKPYPDAPTLAARTPNGQDIRAIALLSPSEGAGRLNLGRALPQLRNDLFGVAFWIAVGAEDNEDEGAAERSYERLTGGGGAAKDRVFLDQFEQTKARGTELLTVRNANIEGRVLAFLDKNLKSLTDKWRDRKSRLR